ncbi:MAG: M3 family metallopeptidase, partial [Planctomycetota bacterium]
MTNQLFCVRNVAFLLLTLATNLQINAAQTTDNPLLQSWDTPFGAPPFDRIKADDFEPAFDLAMQRHLAEIEAICSNPDAPTFDNTIAELENAGEDLGRVQRTFSALTSSATNDELRAIQSRMSPRLAAHASKINLNAALFARIDVLFDKQATLGLNEEQSRVLELTHKRFVRAGAKLEGEDRERLAVISKELAGLYTAFSQNVQKSTEAFALVLNDEDDRAGLPDFVISAAAQAAKDRGMEGHVITLARSSFEPFMTFSTRRDLREKLYTGWTNRGDNDDEFDNESNIRRILQLRLERAQLLGYEDFSSYRTANTMAGTPEAAKELLDEVWVGAVAKANDEMDRIRTIMETEGATHELRAWDWWHYAEKARA